MDLLFSRYASPFLLIDNYIQNNRFFSFICEFINSENERQLWEFYIHKVNNMSFDEFKKSFCKEEITEEQVETTITDSFNTLSNFIPEERG